LECFNLLFSQGADGKLEIFAMSAPFRYAMCNEAFEGQPFRDVCRLLRRLGYSGIEIAPFTLAPDPSEVSAAQRAEYKRIMAGEGLDFVGLHWLLVTRGRFT